MKWMLLLVAAALCAVGSAQGNGKAVVCYIGTWATYRPGDGKFEMEDIEWSPCTHLIYAFAGLKENKIVSLDPWQDLCEAGGHCGFERYIKLKEKKPDLKCILGIGGWNEGYVHFSEMSADPAKRATFVQSVVDFMDLYGFDGLDMDWEYPAYGGNKEDKPNFTLLLKDLYEALHPKGLLVTAALSAGIATIEAGYEVPKIFDYLDFANIMTYDFHGGFNPFIHHNSPMYYHPLDKEHHGDPSFNVVATMEYWLAQGSPSTKLMVGIPLYGHSYTLADKTKTEIYSASDGAGAKGPYTRQCGILGYNEVAEMLSKDGDNWLIVRDPYLVGPYATYNINGGPDRDQWVGYDDVESITEKSTLIEKYNLGGAMVWSMETDDFRGLYHSGPYPLLNAIIGVTPTPIPTPDPSWTTTTPSTTTTVLPDHDICKQEGINDDPDPANCFDYYQCWIGNTGAWELIKRTCGEGTAFNAGTGACDWCENVEGCDC